MTLFIVLIVAAVIMQLAMTTTAEYAVSANESVSSLLDSACDIALVDARKALLDDAQQSQDAANGSGGGGGGPLAAMSGGGGAPGGANPSDPNAQGDSADTLNDAWSHDQETSVGEVQVRVHVEDENRKFNILALVSKDQDYARASRERLIRIIDYLREFNGSDKDVDSGMAETIAANIQQWLEGQRKNWERPVLSSNRPDSTVTAPLSLDELLLVEGIDEGLFYDQKINGVTYPGLESALTIVTSLQAGPITQQELSGTPAPGTDPTSGTSGAQTPGSNTNNPSGANVQTNTPGSTGQTAGTADTPKDSAVVAGKSAGLKININTAPRFVLQALAPNFDIPADVWDAVIRYRNQLDEDKLKQARENGDFMGDELPPGVDAATKIVDRTAAGVGETAPATHYFATLDDLNKVDEWKNCPNDTAKKDLLKLLTTQSDVFTIYVTARPTTGRGASTGQNVDAFGVVTTAPGSDDPDDMPGGIVKRIRQTVWRRVGTSDSVLLPVSVREERYYRKVTIGDFPVDPKTGRPNFR